MMETLFLCLLWYHRACIYKNSCRSHCWTTWYFFRDEDWWRLFTNDGRRMMETSDGVTVATKSTCWTWWRIVYKRSKIIKWVCGAWLWMRFEINQPTSPHQVISYNRPLKMMLRWRHGLLLRLVGVDLNGGVHRVVLLVQTHRWARRIDSTAHARHTNDRCRLFRWSYLKYTKRKTSEMSTKDFQNLPHLKSNASVERELYRIRMIAGLH